MVTVSCEGPQKQTNTRNLVAESWQQTKSAHFLVRPDWHRGLMPTSYAAPIETEYWDDDGSREFAAMMESEKSLDTIKVNRGSVEIININNLFWCPLWQRKSVTDNKATRTKFFF